MRKYYKRIKKQLVILEKYVPVVARVHGEQHPEFLLVKEEFDNLAVIVKDKKRDLNELENTFLKLAEITSNYEVPNDVCKTYTLTYQYLNELHKIYFEDR